MDMRPSLQGRLLGDKLRGLRERRGLTVDELAVRVGLPPQRILELEGGGSRRVRQRDLWCSWGPHANAVLDELCRSAERIDLHAPSGVAPVYRDLDAERCTAYVPAHAPTDRTDVTFRVIPRDAGPYPGLGQPLTLFRMAGGPPVVCYTYAHAVMFTEDPEHTDAACAVFDRLRELTGA
jgi:DNA-binding XRE family transcriptional regulator